MLKVVENDRKYPQNKKCAIMYVLEKENIIDAITVDKMLVSFVYFLRSKALKKRTLQFRWRIRVFGNA
ncbi:MAG: hypothetical protein JWQ14_860 [Adhaeribacter sp.]|jgi:hypothetical protein|nr:hypothetical protein [Adhaeribacter sp.]